MHFTSFFALVPMRFMLPRIPATAVQVLCVLSFHRVQPKEAAAAGAAYLRSHDYYFNMPKVSRTSFSRSRRASTSFAANSSSLSSYKPHGAHSTTSNLANDILNGLRQQANPATRARFENYVKGTTWIGCKTPIIVRTVVKEAVMVASLKQLQVKKKKNKTSPPTSTSISSTDDSNDSDSIILNHPIRLLQQDACDGKSAGMILLQEHYPIQKLATKCTF